MAARQTEQAAREARERARAARWESRQAHALSAWGPRDGRVPGGEPEAGPEGPLPSARSEGGGSSEPPFVVLLPRPPDHPPPSHLREDPERPL
eukprot:6496426-Alexandrium_andersonii.AAC.1